MVAVAVGRAGPLLFSLLVVGCSCAESTTPPDGGSRDGGGPRLDAPVRDAPPRPDTGRADAPAIVDAGMPDTFTPADAPDAFTPPDTFVPPDAPPRVVTCADPAPPGAERAAPAPTYAGTCPTLAPGRNTITSNGNAREFILVTPTGFDPTTETLPVLFLWHWLGGDANGFLTRGEIQAGADEARFIAVIPEAKGDLLLKWPYSLIDSEARIDEEAEFFDDMLACVAEQLSPNLDCVSSAGVSAGALWTSRLAQERGEHLSSILVLSGGVGRSGDFLNAIRPWTGSAHAMPAVVLWGGPSDWCGVSFSTCSDYLEDALTAEGNFFVECVHNCAHAEPPLDPLPGTSQYGGLWRFALDHPYWLEDGESPYLATGLPAGMPTWCGIGPGSATIRSGMCEGGPLGSCM